MRFESHLHIADATVPPMTIDKNFRKGSGNRRGGAKGAEASAGDTEEEAAAAG